MYKLSYFLFRASLYLLIFYSFAVFALKADDIHRSYIRDHVGSRVFMIIVGSESSSHGGGTGFAVNMPSGDVGILTNDHICVVAKYKKSKLFLNKDGVMYPTRIIARSNKTDLCLLAAPSSYEAINNYGGLDLTSDQPTLGQSVMAVGHPKLDALTVSNKGELISVISTQLSEKESAGECDTSNHKFHLIEKDGEQYCQIDLPSAYSTSVFIKRGSSGSPLVDFYGNVVGVVAGMDSYAWGIAVSLDDVIEFLEDK